MTPEQLDEIEKLAAEAPLGEWPEDELWGGEDGFCAQGPYHNCPHGGHHTQRGVNACNEVLSAHAVADQRFMQKATEYALPLVKALREAMERDEHHFKVLEQYRLEVEDYKRRMGDLLDQLAREEADAHQFQKERDVARARLSNLLARIHRDGGHYEAKNGTAKAVVDADATVAQAFAERDEARAEVERLREVVRRVHGLADEEQHGLGLMGAYVRMLEIHKLTKGEE